MRYKILGWLTRKVTKTPIGVIPPKWVRVIHLIFFPLHGFYCNQSHINYDFHTDSYTIHGVGFTRTFFLELGKGLGSYQIIKDKNGNITLKVLLSAMEELPYHKDKSKKLKPKPNIKTYT